MSAQFGTWIGSGAAGTWKPQIDPRLVDDPRFPALLASAAGGVSFAGAVALVTGASDVNSIGYAIARNLAAGGAKVVITGSRDLPRITATAEQLAREAGAGAVLPAQVNQGDFAQLDALLEHVKGQGLAFSHIFPFAAVNHPALFVGIKPEDYARVFAVNVFGVYHLVGKHARQAPRGAPWYVVVPLSPNDGRLQGSGLYPATKQALIPIVVQGQNEVGDRRGGTLRGRQHRLDALGADEPARRRRRGGARPGPEGVRDARHRRRLHAVRHRRRAGAERHHHRRRRRLREGRSEGHGQGLRRALAPPVTTAPRGAGASMVFEAGAWRIPCGLLLAGLLLGAARGALTSSSPTTAAPRLVAGLQDLQARLDWQLQECASGGVEGGLIAY